MYYREELRDIFTVDSSYTFVHCISADFALGKGIALEFQKRFGTRDAIQSRAKPFSIPVGNCIYTAPVLSMITKGKATGLPTYETMYEALYHLRTATDKLGIERIAMPLIGCGLDKLKWPIVRALIKDIFEDSDIEILVCFLQNDVN